jgi:hypothetical protein
MRPRSPLAPGRLMRPNLPGSVSITKITKDTKKSDNENSDTSTVNKMDLESEDDTHILDSDEEETSKHMNLQSNHRPQGSSSIGNREESVSSLSREQPNVSRESMPLPPEQLVLTTDEKLPSEEALAYKTNEENAMESKSSYQKLSRTKIEQQRFKMDQQMSPVAQQVPQMDRSLPLSEQHMLQMEPHLSHVEHDPHGSEPERKINLLKNYRHQRPGSRPQTESSLTQLERTASVLNKEGMPDFRRNLDDITQSYSPSNEERPTTKTKKKKSPNKTDSGSECQSAERPPNSGMSHSVSSLLGPTSNNVQKPRKGEQNMVPVAPIENSSGQRILNRPPMGGLPPEAAMSGMPYPQPGKPLAGQPVPSSMYQGELEKGPAPVMPHPQAMPPGHQYPAGSAPPEGPYGQYPGKIQQ